MLSGNPIPPKKKSSIVSDDDFMLPNTSPMIPAASSSAQAARDEAEAFKKKNAEILLSQASGMMDVKPYTSKLLTDVTLPYEKLQLDNVIRPANVSGQTAQDKAEMLCELFNRRAKQSGVSAFGDVASSLRGLTLNPGEVFIGHCNKVPEMRVYQPNARFVKAVYFTPGYSTGELKLFKQDAPYFHLHGTHVLNVPPGQYALATGNQNEPQIYGEGTHVIDDATFKFDPTKGYVTKNQSHIAHGPIHIVRVSPGSLVAIRINGQPHLLSHHTEPYLFIDPSFELIATHSIADSDYINHDTIQIMRVPAGKVLKLYINNKPALLESREQPYIFNDPMVRLAAKTFALSLDDATKNLIEVGSLKRIAPRTGEKAILYNKGKIAILGPQDNPVLMDDPNVKVDGFVNDTLQTIYIPAKANTAESAYLTVRAGDAVELDIQVAVGYVIVDLNLAMTKLGSLNGIRDHIVNQASAFITREIQNNSSQNFLKINSGGVKSTSPQEGSKLTLLGLLHNELEKYGLDITQFSIEKHRIRDEKLAQQLSQQALVSAKTNTQVATLEQENKIATAQATQKAQADEIAQKRVNDAKVMTAEAELKVAKLHAEAIRAEAEARAHATSVELLAIGSALSQYPSLLPLLIAEKMAKGLDKAQVNLTSEQYPSFMLGALSRNPSSLFANSMPLNLIPEPAPSHSQVPSPK